MWLFFARCDYASAFVSVLAVLKANRVFIRAFPFSAATGARGFVFVTPDFKFSTTDVAVNVGGLGLQQVA
jgi:hypothetical protein